MRLPVHERFIEQAIAYFRQDQRFAGLLAGGSMVHGAMDEYSDLDLIVVYRNEFRSEIMEQRLQIAEGLGNLLSAFTGEHVGEPRLVICYTAPIRFMSTSNLYSRKSSNLESKIREFYGREVLTLQRY